MVDLTKEQQDVVLALVKGTSSQQVQTLGGYAGTGKSTVVTWLADTLPEFAVCAYTGKAANVLRVKGLTATTIHSLIYEPVRLPNGALEFHLKTPERMGCRGFIVDEASMVSREIYEDLLSFNLPIIFVGDHGQLEPVGQDVNVMAKPQYRLEEVHRNAGEIAHFAEHIRKGNHPRLFKGGTKVEFMEPSAADDDALCQPDQMICAYNRFRVEINARVRHAVGSTGRVQVGEKVMCLRNNKPVGLFNGMQGHVTKLRKGNKFDFMAGNSIFTEIAYDPRQFGQEKNVFEFGADTPNPFDYAYCITCHKSQGDEWEKVMVFEQICDKWDHKRWAYTAASRAKEKLIWVCPNQYIPSWL